MYLLSSCSYQATKCKQTLYIIQCEVSWQRLTLLTFHWRIDNLFAHANNSKLQTQNPHLILVLSLPMDQSFSPTTLRPEVELNTHEPVVFVIFFLTKKAAKQGNTERRQMVCTM